VVGIAAEFEVLRGVEDCADLMQRGSKLQGRRQRCRAVIAHRHRLEADAAGRWKGIRGERGCEHRVAVDQI